MSISGHVDIAVNAVNERLSMSLDDTQRAAMREEIEKAVIGAVLEAQQECTEVAVNVCSADRDKAHKIADEINRSKQALISNLSSMR